MKKTPKHRLYRKFNGAKKKIEEDVRFTPHGCNYYTHVVISLSLIYYIYEQKEFKNMIFLAFSFLEEVFIIESGMNISPAIKDFYHKYLHVLALYTKTTLML